MKKQMIRAFCVLLVCAMLFPLTSCSFSFGTLTKVTSSLKSNGYKIERVVPVAMVPTIIKEQMMASTDTSESVDFDIDIQALQWFIIAVSEQNQDGYIICIFRDDASADMFWEQLAIAIPQLLNPEKEEHTCQNSFACPFCAADTDPDFEIEKSGNTIRLIGFDDEETAEVTVIVKEGNIVYIRI